jgi:hypothetical protein
MQKFYIGSNFSRKIAGSFIHKPRLELRTNIMENIGPVICTVKPTQNSRIILKKRSVSKGGYEIFFRENSLANMENTAKLRLYSNTYTHYEDVITKNLNELPDV